MTAAPRSSRSTFPATTSCRSPAARSRRSSPSRSPNLEVTLLDDGASDEYRRSVESLGDPRVRYSRNPERLGAMRNMFAAIETGRGQYTMAFHEDDLLSAGYIERPSAFSNGHPPVRVRRVRAAGIRRPNQPPPSSTGAGPDPAYDMFATDADLVRGILRGVNPMFGSVVYRRAALEHVRPRITIGSRTLVDRPYLLSIMKARLVSGRHSRAAGVVSPSRRRRHAAPRDDDRPRAASACGRTATACPSAVDQARIEALFFSYSGYWLFELYRLTPPASVRRSGAISSAPGAKACTIHARAAASACGRCSARC